MRMRDGFGEGDVLRRNERRIRGGFWLVACLAGLIGALSLVAMRRVVRDLSDVAFHDAADLVEVEKLQVSVEIEGRRARSFLLTGDEALLEGMSAAGSQLATRLTGLRATMVTPEERELLDEIDNDVRAYESALQHAIAVRKGGGGSETVTRDFESRVQPARDQLDRSLRSLAALQERQLFEASGRAKATVAFSLKLLVTAVALALLISGALSVRLKRALAALGAQREEAVRYARRVQELNQELDAFAARASHDLRNLLSPIGLGASVLRRSIHDGTFDRARVEELADKIQRSIDRSVAMLDGLLLFSRSGRPDPAASCSASAVVHDALDELAPLVVRADAEVETDVEDAEVACSAELLRLVVLNLVGNALKFIEGRPRRVVRVEAHPTDDRLELVISDSGPGIPADSLERVFEPFYRVSETAVRGTGVGLATVRRVVEAHGGEVSAESTPGAGATLRVRVPLARGAASSREPSESGVDRTERFAKRASAG